MKRKAYLLALTLVATLSFTACGASAEATSAGTGWDSAASDIYYESNAGYEMASPAAPAENGSSNGSSFNGANYKATEAPDTTRKFITTVNLSGETKEFDVAIESIRNSVKALGGYIQDSSVSGYSSYSSNYVSRDASFTVRVPENKLEDFIATVNGACNVTYSTENVEDVTLNYADTETHLTVLKAERDKLEEMLLACETIEDMVTVEKRLSEVVSEIEVYTSRLRTYDSLISYATVHVNISEVRDYTVVKENPKTVWEEMTEGFMDSVDSIREFCLDMIIFVVSKLPFILILAIIAFVALFFVRKDGKKRAAKKAEDTVKRNQELSARYDGSIVPPEDRENM